MNPRKLTLIILGCMSLLIACSQDNEQENVELRVPVTVEEVSKGDIASFISLTGTLLPLSEMSITSKVNGDLTIKKDKMNIQYTNGSIVRKGDIIATLINENHELNVRIESKKLSLDNAIKDLAEKVKLSELGGIAITEVENAKKVKLDSDLNYKAALLDLKKLEIKANMSGVLTEFKSFAANQQINSGTELGKIMDYSMVRCELDITNDDILKIKQGGEVIITNFAYEDEFFVGQITKISPTIDPTTRTFKIEVLIDNKDVKLRPGMFVKADIVVDKRLEVVRIPKYSIVKRNNRDVVFIIENQVAKMKEITVGLKDSDYAEIMEGLNAKDLLVIRGYETLRDNTKVRVSR